AAGVLTVQGSAEALDNSGDTKLSIGTILFLTSAYIALAVGGSWQFNVDIGFVGGGVNIGPTPLLATLLGFGLMLYVYLRRARRQGGWTWQTAIVEAVRTLVIFQLVILLMGLFTREKGDGIGLRVAVAPTVGWALFWSALTLAVGVVLATGALRGPGM